LGQWWTVVDSGWDSGGQWWTVVGTVVDNVSCLFN